MPNHKVVFLPHEMKITVPDGETIIHAALEAGVHINASCGGEGVCGKCRVRIEEGTLDWVFTSNFFEHLPSKHALNLTLVQANRCLKPGGGIICLGPNIKALHGHYWDFYDHSLPLTDQALKQALELRGFQVETVIPRFLPYTMVNKKIRFLFLVSLYLKIRIAWRFYGKQFLIVARKTSPVRPSATQ